MSPRAEVGTQGRGLVPGASRGAPAIGRRTQDGVSLRLEGLGGGGTGHGQQTQAGGVPAAPGGIYTNDDTLRAGDEVGKRGRTDFLPHPHSSPQKQGSRGAVGGRTESIWASFLPSSKLLEDIHCFHEGKVGGSPVSCPGAQKHTRGRGGSPPQAPRYPACGHLAGRPSPERRPRPHGKPLTPRRSERTSNADGEGPAPFRRRGAAPKPQPPSGGGTGRAQGVRGLRFVRV